MKYRASVLLFVLLISFTAVNCAPAEAQGQKKLETREFVFETRSGANNGAGTGPVVKAEIARTGDERSKGLMGRKSLPDGEGMLFVFERDQILSFWMKNTLIPLSIAFISHEGRILEIHDMKPQDLTSIQSNRSARCALEVPQGWFSRAGIGVGDRLILDL
jgi:uncharacterized membrane protein (UPF0127 family)